MKKLFKLLFLLMLVGVIAAVVAAVVSRKKFENMSDEEIRDFLAAKLEGKVSDEQVASIQDSVIAGVRARSGSGDHYVEDVEDAVEDLTHVAEDIADDAGDAASDTADAASDKAAEAGDKAAEIVAAVVEISEDDGDDD